MSDDVTYAKIPGKNLFLLRSDGVEVHANSKEVRAARAAGKLPATEKATVAEPNEPKRAGRPKKARRPPRDPDEPKPLTRKQQASEYGILAGLAFQGFATVTARPWYALAPQEQSMLGDALGDALPTLPGNAVKQIKIVGPWVKLAMVSMQIVGARVELDRQYQAAAKVPRVNQQSSHAEEVARANGVAMGVPPADVTFSVPKNVAGNGN